MENFLGTHLRNYRRRNELTQKQLANILYVSDRTVSKWERGAGYPDIDTLKRIARLLDISLDNLLNERDPELYFEYCSATFLFNLPLLHIIIPNFSELLWHNRRFALSSIRHKKQLIPAARGIFSIGFFSTGFFSLGVFTKGFFSIGVLSLGFFSAGIVSLGLFSAGNFALGGIAFANLAIGFFTFGNLVLGFFSLGNWAIGYLAIGNRAFGAYASILPEHSDLPEIAHALKSLQREVPAIIRQIIVDPLLAVTSSSLFPYVLATFILFIVVTLCTISFYGISKIRYYLMDQ